jgi:hypothetical protein
VARALRFTNKSEARVVRVFPTMVVGTGNHGSVYAPWSAPGLRAHLIDGPKLYNALRSSGAQAHVEPTGGDGIKVHGDGGRFELKPMPDAPSPIEIPQPPGGAWTFVRPSAFRAAAVFTGDDKVEPPMIAGVFVDGGVCISTDRRGAAIVYNFSDNNTAKIILPRNAFDGIDDDIAYFYVTPSGHAAIGVPSTGEYRVIRAMGDANFPDVSKAIMAHAASFELDFAKLALLKALRKMSVVQSKLSVVRLTISVQDTGPFLEVTGGDPSIAQYVQRVDGALVAGSVPDAFFIDASAELLARLVKVAAGDSIRLGFGLTNRQPIVMHANAVRALVLPLVL